MVSGMRCAMLVIISTLSLTGWVHGTSLRGGGHSPIASRSPPTTPSSQKVASLEKPLDVSQQHLSKQGKRVAPASLDPVAQPTSSAASVAASYIDPMSGPMPFTPPTNADILSLSTNFIHSERQTRRDVQEQLRQSSEVVRRLKADKAGTINALFVAWSNAYAVKYGDLAESSKALAAFNNSVSRLEKFNIQGSAFHVALNEFSGVPWSVLSTTSLMSNYDSSRDEERAARQAALQKKTAATRGGRRSLQQTLPPLPLLSWNWKDTGRLLAVRRQGTCGSCWATAAAAAMEVAFAIQYPTVTKSLLRVSAQQMVDCTNSQYLTGNYHSDGCNSGHADEAMAMLALKNSVTNSAYPYISAGTNAPGVCNTTALNLLPSSGAVFKVPGNGQYRWLADQMVYGFDNVEYVTTQSELALMAAVLIRPVICAWATSELFYSYSSGVYNGDCGATVSHNMLIVGYDFVNKFWIVMNSWGTTWGMDGYANIIMDGTTNGRCLMYTALYAPKLTNAIALPSSAAIFVPPPPPLAKPPSPKPRPPSPKPPPPSPKPSPPRPKPPPPRLLG